MIVSEAALTLNYVSPEDAGSAVARGQGVNTVCSGRVLQILPGAVEFGSEEARGVDSACATLPG